MLKYDKHHVRRFSGSVPAHPPAQRPTSDATNALDANGIDTRPKPGDFANTFVIPHHLTFTAVWQAVSKTYRSLDDEAKRNNYQNALAMKLDTFNWQLIRARQYPTVGLPFSIEVEDPDDPYQKEVSELLRHLIDAIPRFQNIKLGLLDAIWYGKSAVQLQYGKVRVRGKNYLLPIKHLNVNGDKLVFSWDHVPGVLIYRPWKPDDPSVKIVQTDWGPALFLYDDYYRDRFLIHQYEPNDSDYLYQSELHGEIHGNGIRSQIYWVWNIKQEILHWAVDALQRISTNGLLIGKYPAGNEPAQQAMAQVLKDLSENCIALLPVDPNNDNVSGIEAITPSTVAYDTLYKFISYFDEIIEKLVLGQNLSSGTAPTGMGSDVASLHAQTLEQRIRYDAVALAETLTRDLLQPIIKFNFGELPFNVKLTLQVEKQNVKDQMIAAKTLYDMGVSLDEKNLRDQAGFPSPKADNQTVQRPPVSDFRIADDGKTGDTRVQEESE